MGRKLCTAIIIADVQFVPTCGIRQDDVGEQTKVKLGDGVMVARLPLEQKMEVRFFLPQQIKGSPSKCQGLVDGTFLGGEGADD